MNKNKKAEGYRNVSSAWDVLPAAITPETILGFQNSIHYQGALNNLETQVFPGPPEVWVEDPDNERDDALSSYIAAEFRRLNCYDRMQYVLSDVCGWGASVMSVGFENAGEGVRIAEIRHLSGSSFSSVPHTRSDYTIVNPLMPGIIVTDDGETEVWQTNPRSFEQMQISNYSLITKPGVPSPSGRSFMLPVYTEISRVEYAIKALLQHINREGAPRVFPKVMEGLGHESYRELIKWGGEFSRNYNKDSVFVIPPGIEFPALNVVESNVASDTIDKLVEWIRYFTNPMSQMEETGNLGASDSSRMEIWTNTIAAWQELCELWLEEQFDYVLEANGFEGYKTNIQLKRPNLDRASIRLQTAQTGVQLHFVTREQAYNLVAEDNDLPPYSPEIGKQLEKEAEESVPVTFGNLKGFTSPERKIEAKMERELQDVTEETEKEIAEILLRGGDE